jgi:hypothetical protein
VLGSENGGGAGKPEQATEAFEQALGALQRAFDPTAPEVRPALPPPSPPLCADERQLVPVLHHVARFFAVQRDRMRADGMYRHLVHLLESKPRGPSSLSPFLCLFSWRGAGTAARRAQVLRDFAGQLRAFRLEAVAEPQEALAARVEVCLVLKWGEMADVC